MEVDLILGRLAPFSPQEVAALVSLIVTINARNAIGLSTRAWTPGSYQP
jgi:hypothetical protein